MHSFQSHRIAHEYTQTSTASPEKVFPLLCPVREADWIPGWQYQLIYSESGVAELGCVFTTPGREGEPEATWICVDYDPAAFRVAYVRIQPGRMTTEICIQLSRAENGHTRSHICYRYTGLSQEGNREVDRHDRAWFESDMRVWEARINHYLNTGKMAA